MKRKLLVPAFIFVALAGAAQSKRLVLFEEFTGENCGPCAATNPGLDALLALPQNTAICVALKWQVPIPSAPSNTWSLYRTNKAEIDWRYRGHNGSTNSTNHLPPTSLGYGYVGAGSVNGQPAIVSGVASAPMGKLDGQRQIVFGAPSDHPANLTSARIANAAAVPSAFDIKMLHEFNAAHTAITVSVDIKATANFNAVGPLVFRCVMIEKKIEFATMPGTNGEKVFHDVAIKSFPDIQNGTSLPSAWTVNQTQSFVVTCPLPSYVRRIDQIGFVGFIQDDGDRKVAQAARSEWNYEIVAEKLELDPVSCFSSITPTIMVSNAGSKNITTMTIDAKIDGNSVPQISWTGMLAPGANTTIAVNAINSPTTFGGHSFNFTITSIDGIDNILANNSMVKSYLYGNGSTTYSVAEGFVPATFPPAKWMMENTDNGPAWSRVAGTTLGGYGSSSSCMRYDFFTNTKKGDMDEIYLEPMDLLGTATPSLFFDYAYSRRDANSNDKLEVFVSDDCGQNWNSVFMSQGQAMETSGAPKATQYVPATFEWATTHPIPLPGMNKQNILVKFVTTNDNGNSLYIDNINLSQSAPTEPVDPNTGIINHAVNTSVSVFPNPASGVATVRIEALNDNNSQLTIVNTLGQVVSNENIAIKAGRNDITLNVQNLAAGVYQVVISDGKTATTSKLSINK